MSPKGGKRENAGRPRILDEPRVTSVHLSTKQIDYARRIGNGGISAGIRRIIDDHMKEAP